MCVVFHFLFRSLWKHGLMFSQGCPERCLLQIWFLHNLMCVVGFSCMHLSSRDNWSLDRFSDWFKTWKDSCHFELWPVCSCTENLNMDLIYFLPHSIHAPLWSHHLKKKKSITLIRWDISGSWKEFFENLPDLIWFKCNLGTCFWHDFW